MKKLAFFCLLTLCVLGGLTMPVFAYDMKPVAFIVIDKTGEVNNEIFRDWEQQVRQGYHDLRAGVFDVLVGINLLREGLDLPEVSLIAILDADKEGFLRSDTAMIQTIGRAARNVHGRVIMYADRITGSMERAIGETDRRRKKQEIYNSEHGITPKTIEKKVVELIRLTKVAEEDVSKDYSVQALKKSSEKILQKTVKELDKKMAAAAKELDFERAAEYRDRIILIKGELSKRKQ